MISGNSALLLIACFFFGTWIWYNTIFSASASRLEIGSWGILGIVLFMGGLYVKKKIDNIKGKYAYLACYISGGLVWAYVVQLTMLRESTVEGYVATIVLTIVGIVSSFVIMEEAQKIARTQK